MSDQLLSRVNDGPAQTWNYLHINSIDFSPEAASAALPEQTIDWGAALPSDAPKESFATLEMSSGAEAQAWLQTHSTRLRYELLTGEQSFELALESGIQTSLIEIAPHTHARIILAAGARADAETLMGHSLRIVLGEAASLEFVGVYDLQKTPFVEGVGIELAEGAQLSWKQYILSGTKTALGMAANQQGTRSSVDVLTRYLIAQNETLDMSYTSRMRGVDTLCNMNFSGVLGEGGEKNLRDTIDLIHGAKGAQGKEAETVLLTGENLINRSLPTILCDEDDVAGDHGATIGSVSDEQLLYLGSRGLSEQDVAALFTRAVIDDAYAHSTGKAQELVLAACERQLGSQVVQELKEGTYV